MEHHLGNGVCGVFFCKERGGEREREREADEWGAGTVQKRVSQGSLIESARRSTANRSRAEEPHDLCRGDGVVNYNRLLRRRGETSPPTIPPPHLHTHISTRAPRQSIDSPRWCLCNAFQLPASCWWLHTNISLTYNGASSNEHVFC